MIAFFCVFLSLHRRYIYTDETVTQALSAPIIIISTHLSPAFPEASAAGTVRLKLLPVGHLNVHHIDNYV